MTSIEIHKAHIKEHIQELADAIAIGLEKRPATIGLHISACAIELLELYLHKTGKISSGAMIKHEWFKAPTPNQKILPLAERKLAVQFPDKEKILSFMYIIEEERNKLIYGKPSIPTITASLNAFQKLHEILKEKIKDAGEEIE